MWTGTMLPWARRLGCVLALDKCVQMGTRNYGALGQTARVCFGVLCANRTREVKRDFGDLRIRRSEGRVVNTPLVFKRVLFEERGRKRRGDPKGEVGEKKDKRVRERERTEGGGETEKREGDGKRRKESRGERVMPALNEKKRAESGNWSEKDDEHR
ncbi:hypothetical protein TNCV_1099811 [Trichonephila clavipes]|nr:hypothetical protein TNCV_1099811 [Trichonephila clavipes]